MLDPRLPGLLLKHGIADEAQARALAEDVARLLTADHGNLDNGYVVQKQAADAAIDEALSTAG